jgi:hypothetical protein
MLPQSVSICVEENRRKEHASDMFYVFLGRRSDAYDYRFWYRLKF